MSNEVRNLRRWKSEALPRLAVLDELHELLPPDAKAGLGRSKDEALLTFLRKRHV